MKRSFYLIAALTLLFCGLAICAFKWADDEHPTLAIGAKAPNFRLLGVDGKYYTLNSFKNSPVLMVIFTCNHCPTAQAYEERIIQLTKDYKDKGVAVVAIMPNDAKAITLDELGWSDLSDTYAEMKIRARQKHFNFPYLYDGGTQSTARAYGPVATPHVFIFDRDRKLCYNGRIDDVEKPTKTPHVFDTRNALDAVLAHKMPEVTTTKVFGCSIKWAEKKNNQPAVFAKWAKEPVSINTIGVNGLKAIVQNRSDSLRVINLWATWCGPCVAEFPDLVNIKHMFSRRDFQFVTVSADDPSKKAAALKFLKEEHASGLNFIFNTDDKYKLIEAIDPKWAGGLPYTIVVEPGGKIVYAHEGQINYVVLKKLIVENKYIGRYF